MTGKPVREQAVYFLGLSLNGAADADKQLDSLTSTTPSFSLIMLSILSSPSDQPQIRLAASIFFKNLIKKLWPTDRMTADERSQIKGALVQMMVTTDPLVSRQLGEALTLVAEHDWPSEWPNLLPELCGKLAQATASGDWSSQTALVALTTLGRLFKRYKTAFKNDETLRELSYALGLVQAPLLQAFESIAAAQQLTVAVLRCAKRVARIFYALNMVDLPEFFEDHMQQWMTGFRRYLSAPRSSVSGDDDKLQALIKLQAAICSNLNLYAEKYEEEFLPYLGTFLGDIWNLLLGVGNDPQYDQLAIAGIKFLTGVSVSVQHQQLGREEVLKSVCSNVVTPNMLFRDSDEELFEDNPNEYIRRDVEGSDADTRRRAALELVRGLRKNYESQVTQYFAADIQRLLNEYASQAEGSWRAKDVAISLITAVAVTATNTAQGAVTTNNMVPIADLYRSHVLPELQTPKATTHPVVKADCIKFITTFRRVLTTSPEANKELFTVLVNSLGDSNYVVQTYAATAIEKMLSIREQQQPGQQQQQANQQLPQMRFTKEFVASCAGPLVEKLFGCLPINDDLRVENEYVMRALLKVFAVLKEQATSISSLAFGKLIQSLKFVSQNPRNPHFNHALFESIACLTKNVVTANHAALHPLESLLLPVFQEILVKDVADFMPYVFQLLAMLIELNPGTVISVSYWSLFSPLLVPALWDRSGSVPALTRLLGTYVRRAPREVAAGGHLPQVLGVFQRLLSSTTTDHDAFVLLSAVSDSYTAQELNAYASTILRLCFTRMQSCRNAKLTRGFVAWLARVIIRHGAATLFSWADTVQPHVFAGLMDAVWTAHLPWCPERKVTAVGTIKLLCHSPEVLAPPYITSWGKVFNALVALITGDTAATATAAAAAAAQQGDDTEDAAEVAGVGTTFAQLAYASKPDVDTPMIKQVMGQSVVDTPTRGYLVQSLHQLSAAHPGKFSAILQQACQGDNAQRLTKWFQEFNIPQPYIL